MKTTLIFLAMVCVTANAQTAPASSGKNINGSGCVEKAENSCHVVIDSQTGELYALLFPTTAPQPGIAIQFSGTQRQSATACMQGKPVNVSKWKREKGIRCPPPVIEQTGR